ncbi:hypothetical protein WICANDRAFT_28518 [Wickerhamomyces anomalus NRRL Y-366-8]|uniref:Methyltransferase type 11 domain-containing protein n=1 Tax=Wickerhamomyces anomalus (strain ATCC 58044 / CBS 1984 / NCYC 433 / NRRL Y-366-8) TaxID=683960 RepID=A0A1E3P5W2_WICAA|nr:uncharacterized protein WICANDRAFT_28518 [Wickerhamomyces anomalus NRRL Y-366-8]ODQ60829.1 hypothetical protein WICANDRAFT_28518 [Wickerhamomyces anomalus NRRL Y-366-8]
MSAFSDQDFLATNYTSYRPAYPPSFFKKLSNYHKGDRKLAVDVGCGPGEATYPLVKYFDHVVGVDISEVMIKEASKLRKGEILQKVEFKVGSGESIPAEPHSVDLLTAAECFHWFDHEKFFQEACRVLKLGGTLAYWGYSDPVFIDYPDASLILERYVYLDPEYLGPYWEYPGTNLLKSNYRDVNIPTDRFTDIERVEHEPGTRNEDALVPGVTAQGSSSPLQIHRDIPLDFYHKYVTTWSSYHNWKKANPKSPDMADAFIKELETKMHWNPKTMVHIEWLTVLKMARKRLR